LTAANGTPAAGQSATTATTATPPVTEPASPVAPSAAAQDARSRDGLRSRERDAR